MTLALNRVTLLTSSGLQTTQRADGWAGLKMDPVSIANHISLLIFVYLFLFTNLIIILGVLLIRVDSETDQIYILTSIILQHYWILHINYTQNVFYNNLFFSHVLITWEGTWEACYYKAIKVITGNNLFNWHAITRNTIGYSDGYSMSCQIV